MPGSWLGWCATGPLTPGGGAGGAPGGAPGGGAPGGGGAPPEGGIAA